MPSEHAMKVLIVTTSRADWNGLGMVVRELVRREIGVWVAAYTVRAPDWAAAISEDSPRFDYGVLSVGRACIEYQPDVAVVAGDRFELLEACITLCKYKVPICHIGGGDITEGSMDDRYRDAITALSCIHCVETIDAYDRMVEHQTIGPLSRRRDSIYHTGQPGLDRIKQTTPEMPGMMMLSKRDPNVLFLVHPNTTHKDSQVDADAIIEAINHYPRSLYIVALGANADAGGDLINGKLQHNPRVMFINNLRPAEFYWMLAHCDVLLGNSSAGTAEAPCFGIPVVNVGDRQKGREFGPCTAHVAPDAAEIRKRVFQMVSPPRRCPMWHSPYGDGESAPRIVKALEDNTWRWAQ